MDYARVRRARDLIAGTIPETQCILSTRLSRVASADLFLKLENKQETGAFKERGALVKLLSLSPKERARGATARAIRATLESDINAMVTAAPTR